jgi:hypothetical protein
MKKNDLYHKSLKIILSLVREDIQRKKNANSLSVLQIGVSDGIEHDCAKDILNCDDVCVFCEPIKSTFNIMKNNKSCFNNSIFLNIAIVPYVLRNNNKMNLLKDDPIGQGSSFGSFNEKRIYSTIEVKTLTVEELINKYNLYALDLFFCDAESIDHLIIQDLLQYTEPEFLFFETCWWCKERVFLNLSDGTNTSIPSRKDIKDFLQKYDYSVIDFLEDNHVEKREDMLAIKNKYIL